MPVKFIFLICLLGNVFTIHAQKKHYVPSVIFDSDMGPDYDDVGAITLLHALADSGQVKILATVASTNYEGVAGVFNVFNTYFHRPGLPIGVAKTNGLKLRDWQHWTDTLLAKYPHRIRSNNEVPDAVEIYRRILAAQPDKTVTIITVGFMTNLANLFRSQSDEYSSLTGIQLVKKKVRLLVSMAGRFPSGKEFNLDRDAVSSRYVFTHLPIPVIFSGFEIGEKLKTGLPLINNNLIKNSPVKDVFRICIPMAKEDSAGRKSWDETAVLIAVKGPYPFYTLQKGKIEIREDGSNSWTDQNSPQAHLKERIPPVAVKHLIDKLIMHQPY